MRESRERVVVAMSGGVDSSVAAHLLHREGYDLVGVFMRHGEETAGECRSKEPTDLALPILGKSKGCCTAMDAADARDVADKLNIPFYAINLRSEFQRIINYFVQDYSQGRTPNPCVMCNNWIKFGKLFEYADSIGARYVATGHYARLTQSGDGDIALRRGIDASKDQSYVLFGVQQSYLSRMLLPVGGFQKSEIRRLAIEFGLSVAEKPDSQDICFVASGDHAKYVADHGIRDTCGELVTTDGRVVGTHGGIERFTVGQRKGLGVAMGEPYFVVRIDSRSNQVVIGRLNELACRRLIARDLNWLVPMCGDMIGFPCDVQIRYNSRATKARATILGNGSLRVEFETPCLGVAPGQAVVCYDGDHVLGGGWIDSSDSPDSYE